MYFLAVLLLPHSLLKKLRALIPWRTRIDLDPQCLDATVLNLVEQFNRYDKNYLSSLAGADLCKRLSGTHSKCHDLSFDLSSTCNSRELIFRINPQARIPLSCRAHGPIHAFHLHLRHHLHQLLHIQFHLAWPLHLAHLPCLVHQPKLSHLVLHPFRHLSLVILALHI